MKENYSFFAVLSGGWGAWLEDEACLLNPKWWTRKGLHSLLATRTDSDMAGDIEKDEEKTVTKEENAYDSDDDGGPLIRLSITGVGEVHHDRCYKTESPDTNIIIMNNAINNSQRRSIHNDKEEGHEDNDHDSRMEEGENDGGVSNQLARWWRKQGKVPPPLMTRFQNLDSQGKGVTKKTTHKNHR